MHANTCAHLAICAVLFIALLVAGEDSYAYTNSSSYLYDSYSSYFDNAAANAPFVCGVNLYAFESGQGKLPSCALGQAAACDADRTTLWNALSMSGCGWLMPAVTMGSPLPAFPSEPSSVFVSALIGSDSNAGTTRTRFVFGMRAFVR